MDLGVPVGACLVNGNPAFPIDGRFVVYQVNERRFYSCEGPSPTEAMRRAVPSLRLSSSAVPGRAELMLVVTRDCNLRCSYCFAYGGDVRTRMTLDVALASIRKVLSDRKPDSLKVVFSGGEATTNPEVIRGSVEFLEESGIPCVFVVASNGVIPPVFLKYLIEKRFFFSFSLDGTPDVHDALRPLAGGRPSSPFVEATIGRLVDSGASFRTRTSVTADTVSRLPEFVRYFASLGVRRVAFELLDPWGRAGDAAMPLVDLGEFCAAFLAALDEAERLGGISVGTSALINFRSPSRSVCPGVDGRQMIVLPDGSVTRCNDVMDASHPLGGVFLVGGYDPVSGEVRVTSPEKAKRLDGLDVEAMAPCGECFVKYVCAGGCMARHLWLSGSRTPGDVSGYHCAANRMLLAAVIRRLWRKAVSNARLPA